MRKPHTLAQRIDALAKWHGSLHELARATKVSVSYLSRLRADERATPSEAVLRKLGLRRVVSYEVA